MTEKYVYLITTLAEQVANCLNTNCIFTTQKQCSLLRYIRSGEIKLQPASNGGIQSPPIRRKKSHHRSVSMHNLRKICKFISQQRDEAVSDADSTSSKGSNPACISISGPMEVRHVSGYSTQSNAMEKYFKAAPNAADIAPKNFENSPPIRSSFSSEESEDLSRDYNLWRQGIAISRPGQDLTNQDPAVKDAKRVVFRRRHLAPDSGQIENQLPKKLESEPRGGSRKFTRRNLRRSERMKKKLQKSQSTDDDDDDREWAYYDVSECFKGPISCEKASCNMLQCVRYVTKRFLAVESCKNYGTKF